MKSRSDAMQQIAGQTFDVCVIGGGATGAGCALDAQLRGLKTVLIEAGDFASETSSKSTKMVHGGVRYLQQAVSDLDIGQYRIVKRALRERKIMLDNAPFLAHPFELLVPCFSWREVFYYRVGMKLYDWIAGKGNLRPSSFLPPAESLKRLPMLNPNRLVGTVAYTDGQFDDSRYDMALIQTFTQAGGQAVNYAPVMGLGKDSRGKLAEAEIEDRISHRLFTVGARAFVNATGPFSDRIREMAKPGIDKRLRLSKGIHILLPLDSGSAIDAMLIPKTDDGRVIFAIPWLGRFLVGTTDDEANLEDELIVTRAEAEYLLRHLNRYLRKPFTTDQICSGIAGLRPLVKSKDALDTKKLIRDHEVELEEESGLISVLGGKWTTYRAMAEDGIDAVQRYLGGPVTPCLTRTHRLVGSEGYTLDYRLALGPTYRVPAGTVHHLSGKFGTDAVKILELTRQEPSLKAAIVEGLPPIQAEVVYSAREEMAMSIEDVLARRIGVQSFSWKHAISAAPVVASLLARELNWSSAQRQQAIAEYVSKITRFREGVGLPPEPALAKAV